MASNRSIDDLVDIALADSFPASDPPYFMAAAAVVGAPRRGPARGTPVAGPDGIFSIAPADMLSAVPMAAKRNLENPNALS